MKLQANNQGPRNCLNLSVSRTQRQEYPRTWLVAGETIGLFSFMCVFVCLLVSRRAGGAVVLVPVLSLGVRGSSVYMFSFFSSDYLYCLRCSLAVFWISATTTGDSSVGVVGIVISVLYLGPFWRTEVEASAGWNGLFLSSLPALGEPAEIVTCSLVSGLDGD